MGLEPKKSQSQRSPFWIYSSWLVSVCNLSLYKLSPLQCITGTLCEYQTGCFEPSVFLGAMVLQNHPGVILSFLVMCFVMTQGGRDWTMITWQNLRGITQEWKRAPTTKVFWKGLTVPIEMSQGWKKGQRTHCRAMVIKDKNKRNTVYP